MAVPMPDQQFLWNVFQSVDKDRSGVISATELQGALSNGTWKPFNPETVTLLIGIFDRDNTGTIDFNEFCALWKYVTDWLNCFKTFDKDNSGTIDRNELKIALTTIGFHLSDAFYDIFVRRYCKNSQSSMTFDDYIHACVMLQTLTSVFQNHDKDRTGWINVSYEQFLIMVCSTMLR